MNKRLPSFNKHLASFVLGCAVALSAGASVAQRVPTPAERERQCAIEARKFGKIGITGERYDAFMRRCTGSPVATSGPALPPAQPPGAGPPPQPPAAAPPLSPLAIRCNQMMQETGISGAKAKTYLERCLARGRRRYAIPVRSPCAGRMDLVHVDAGAHYGSEFIKGVPAFRPTGLVRCQVA